MKPKPYRAAIKFEDKQITFEGPKDFVESMVAKYTLTSKPQAKPGDAEYISDSTISAGGGNERDLVAAKRPRGHHETVAVLAFALTQAGKPEFTDEDVHRAYIRAGVRPPKVMAQALRDAKNKYDYLEVAGARGRYRLTNHGDRVVRFDLPAGGTDK